MSLLTIVAYNIMHVSRFAVAVDTRVYHQHLATNSGQTAQSAQPSRTTADNDGIVLSPGPILSHRRRESKQRQRAHQGSGAEPHLGNDCCFDGTKW